VEKAIIQVRLNKKGDLCGELIFEDTKKVSLPSWVVSHINIGLNNTECRVEREKGQPVKVVIEGIEYKKPATRPFSHVLNDGKSRQDYKYGRQNRQTVKNESIKDKRGFVSSTVQQAVAPYNFVPLNKKAILVEENPCPMDIYSISEDRPLISGKISLDIEALTPFFIRGTVKEEDLSKNDDELRDHNFFSPGGRFKIPGSSLRGMIRTLVEIAGYGKFENFDGDRRLYYRSVYGKTAQTRKYRSKMVDQKNNRLFVKAGILKRIGSNEFAITPSPEKGVLYYRVKFNRNDKKIIGLDISAEPSQKENYSFKEIWFEAGSPGSVVKALYLEKMKDNKNLVKGYLVCSGLMNNKNKQWIIQAPKNEKQTLPISEEVIESYLKDESRNAVNLLEIASSKANQEVPCFYLQDSEEKVIAFGHTAYFRLIYNKRIKDHLPEDLNNIPDSYDLAESIFGVAGKFSSRVYFEDADMVKKTEPHFVEENHHYPKILSTPKPTSFQHYLLQGNTDQHEPVPRENLENWDSEKHIRGYKLYWHRNINSVKENDLHSWIALPEEVKKHSSQYTARIKPVKPGVKFKGCIRFENLSVVELGALLFVIDLPEHCYHKLGLAKPLGFGSIKIEPSLVIIDRCNRYKTLFANEDWYRGEQEDKEKELIYEYKNAFAKYILERIGLKVEGENHYDLLWQDKRMVELRHLLTWPQTCTEWLNKSMYMELSAYSNRPVLPEPSHVRRNQ